MRIEKIQPIGFDGVAKIRGLDNKKHPFLYNEIENLRKEFKFPANFKTQEIELPSVSVDIFRKLNELKIRFYSGKKH